MNDYELVLCIVNHGFSDDVMDISRAVGARGGTVINARGTARSDAEKMFNIVIEPEKEIVLMVVQKQIKDDLLHALYKNIGLNTPGGGIAFSLPVDDVAGLTPIINKEEIKDGNQK